MTQTIDLSKIDPPDVIEELDFRLEAENMLDVAEVFAQLGQRGWIIARPHPELVTRRVLVMERLEGFAFEDLESMQAAGIDTHETDRVGTWFYSI